jgi:hypothetical protein
VATTCTRCEGTGFLNLELMDAAAFDAAQEDNDPHARVLEWIAKQTECDVSVCDCCGNGDDTWHEVPGEHNEGAYGKSGPYAYNGGLPECA